MTSRVSPRMLRGWLGTAYAADGVVARIGERSAAMDAVLRSMRVRDGAFVAAGNPGGRRWPTGGCNARLHAALLGQVRRLPWRQGEGAGRGWREAHLLLGCDQRRARVLARRFRQAGIVLVGIGRSARLLLLARR